MNRRTWMIGAAGAAALAAGAGWQAWRGRNADGAAPTAAPAQAAASGPASAFWAMSFPAPDGSTVQAAAFRGQALLLNFWGTWCPPCVKEMPDLDAFAREHASKGWRVLGLAVDNPKAVREFLAKSPVGYTIGLAGFDGSELARQLGNDQSGLPFTVAFDRAGRVSHRKSGATTLDELRGWARNG
jgi:thiol-disulfide isomerase/thioredoxin